MCVCVCVIQITKFREEYCMFKLVKELIKLYSVPQMKGFVSLFPSAATRVGPGSHCPQALTPIAAQSLW